MGAILWSQERYAPYQSHYWKCMESESESDFFFLLDGKLLFGVNNVKCHNVIISDHCPGSVSLKLHDLKRHFGSWRLDPQLLTRKQFCEYLDTQIEFCFETNSSPVLLWESFKAYIRGCFISYQSSQKKRNNQKQTDLEELIWKLHAENAAQRSTEKYNQISALKYQLNTLTSEKNSKPFTSTEQTFLNSGINLISSWQDNCQRGKVIGLFIR